MKKFIPMITIVALLLMLVPNAVLAQDPAECEHEYTIQAGDWLSKIAEKYYGDPLGYEIIVAANNIQADDIYTDIDNADIIEPGWVLCIPGDGDATTGPQPAPEGLSQQDLANASYNSTWTQAGTAPLTNGEYSEEAAPDSATKTEVKLTDNVAYGELNGQESAAVVLYTAPGGSGTFYDLAIMVNQEGTPVNVATTQLGDRVQIQSITVENNQVKVDMIQAGPDDPLCCPTQRMLKSYEIQGEQLVEVASEEVAHEDMAGEDMAGDGMDGETMAPESSGLAGSEWLLVTLNGQPALEEAPITAKFGTDGTVSGTSGCNGYSFGYEVDGNNITTTTLGPSTLIACEDAVNQQETDFRAAFGLATTYTMTEGSLELADAEGNVIATFTPLEVTSLADTSWIVHSYNNGRGGVVTTIIGTELTANFGTDGMLIGFGGCNDYSASYETEGDTISIGPAISTQKACDDPEGVLDQEIEYLTALGTAATYKIELGQMEMRTTEGSLVGMFTAVYN